MTVDEIKRNIELVTERVARASARSGRAVTVVAAAKNVPAEFIDVAVDSGIDNIGENRVQEYLGKKDGVQRAIWHFIGTLQRNKAKYLVGNVALIQSVNCIELAREIDRLARLRNIRQQVLIELNAAGEQSKTGAPVDTADDLIAEVRELKNVVVRGIMSVPPKDAGDAVYAKLAAKFEKHKSDAFDILSVGMSSDYERAIAQGSNMVRPGTAIFGSRTYR